MTKEDYFKFQYYIGCTIKLQIIESQTQYNRDIDNFSRNLSTTVNRKEIIVHQWTPGVAVAVNNENIEIDFGDGVIIPFYYFSYSVMYKGDSYIGRGENATTLKVNGQKYKVEIINPEKDYYSDLMDKVYIYVDKLTSNTTTNEVVDSMQ